MCSLETSVASHATFCMNPTFIKLSLVSPGQRLVCCACVLLNGWRDSSLHNDSQCLEVRRPPTSTTTTEKLPSVVVIVV